ncbi:MAG TPA: MarR family transcriptional regulator [Chloroflexota bacterium]
MDSERTGLSAIDRELMLFVRRVELADRIGTLDRSAYLLLAELEANGPLGITALAQTFHLDISTASRQTAALEAKGLVERLPHPADARVNLLRITQLGQTQLDATRVARLEFLSELLDDWSEDDRRQFGANLLRFNQALARRRGATAGR